MKEKIYAKTLNPEFFDYRVYDIREDDGNKVIIDGGRDFNDIDKNGELKVIKKAIDNYGGYEYEFYYHNSIKDYLNDYLYPLKKENEKQFSPLELHKINIALEDAQFNDIDVRDAIATILSIIHGEPYTHSGLRGYCQGDYVEAYYPTSTSQKEIDYVEAWFFGTGTEIVIHDSDTIPESEDDIDGYSILSTAWSDDGLKKDIRETVGCDDDVEIILWKWTGSHQVTVDHYEKV